MATILKLSITNLGESLPRGRTWEELAQEIHKGSESRELLIFLITELMKVQVENKEISEARFGTLLREGRLASRAFRDEAFWQSQVNFGPPNPATDEKALWSKGKRVRCHTPCLPKVPRGRARRSRATTRERIPHRQGDRRRPSQGASRPTGNTGETWEGNPIGSQRIHSTRSLPDFIFIILKIKPM
ncbi:hypothetical protein CASFOL_009608 [Castilleja foliolosa]|uniref:Uncharacterized protein n=2 Tax=Castilleja foliolosa TaxID=1961234 RepID=A0ABD3DWK7_9LAMI